MNGISPLGVLLATAGTVLAVWGALKAADWWLEYRDRRIGGGDQ